LRHWRWYVGALTILAVLLVATACAEKEKPTIKFSDNQWQSLWINNAIAMYIIEKGYGYPTEQVTLTTPVMQVGLPKGEVHVQMEIWKMSYMDWYNETIAAGTMENLGPIFEASRQGWYVPTYVIKGDPERGIDPMAPDLKSVLDLPKYLELFKDPEDPSKGRLISCIIGWFCAEVQRERLEGYGLDEYYNLLEPGTTGALDAALAGPYKKGEPVLSYYWEPTWLMGAYDFTMLEEPAYDAEIWATTKACGYDTPPIDKGVWSGLRDMAPDVVEFLEKMNVWLAPLNAACAYNELGGATIQETAIWYLREYEDIWSEWVPDKIKKKVKDAVDKEPASPPMPSD